MRILRSSVFLMFSMGIVVFMELLGSVRALEIMLFTCTETKTNQDGEKGETFHQRLY